MKWLETLKARLLRREQELQQRWAGTFLSPDEIVADMLARIRKDPVAVQRWLDPWSWKHPAAVYLLKDDGTPKPPDHAGCLFDAGRAVRNWYGLWKPECPYTKLVDTDLELTDGVITDPLFPDNLSATIIDRVKATLQKEHADAEL